MRSASGAATQARMKVMRILITLIAMAPVFASATTLIVRLPEGMTVTSALVSSWGAKGAVAGKVELAARTVLFADVRPDVRYDVALVLEDGTVLQGVDLGWYGLDVAK